MWKKIAISGAVAAAIVGSGTVALAATGSSSPSAPTPTTSSSAAAHPGAAKAKAKAGIALRKIEHGEWTTRDKSGADVVHDAVGGTVTAVNGSSITVKATDGFSETFAVASSTKVHVKGKKPAAITDVKVNDRAVVAGTKSGSTVTATQILDAGTK